jgi:PAS domain S-box-containing protein
VHGSQAAFLCGKAEFETDGGHFLLSSSTARKNRRARLNAKGKDDTRATHEGRTVKEFGSFKAGTYLSLFGLAVTVPLLLLVGALLLQSASVQRAQLEGRVLQALNALVGDLDRDLDQDITILHTLATSEALANADWRKFYDQAQAALQGRAYLVLVDSTGRQLLNTYVPYGQQPAMTGDPETVRRIVQTKLPVVSNLFTSLVVRKPVFNVSIPILKDGQVRYVMSLGLLPEDLVRLLQAHKLGSEWVTLVWDAKGVLLARSRDNQRFVGKPLPQNMREHDEPAVLRTTSLDGADVLHATARSKVSGWGVGVNIGYAVISAQRRNSLFLWGAASLIAIVIALAAGGFFASQITTSLSAATKAAAAFGDAKQFPLTGSRLNEADTFLVTLDNARQARERLMEKVATSERRARNILESISEAFMLLDEGWRYSEINPAAEKILGKPASELVGRVHWEEHRETIGTQVETQFRKAVVENIPVHFENYYEPWDRWFEIAAYPSAEGLGVYFRDITERKRAEAALVRLNEDLTHFTFAATHDVREPLRMVSIHAQMLERKLEGQLSDEASGYVKQVLDGANRISRLIDGLLEFSRVGNVETSERATANTEAAFEEAMGNLTVSLEESNGVVTHDRLPTVAADEVLVCQVFQNLVGNAVKYHRPGIPPRIHISVTSEGDLQVFAVRDNGIGIPHEYQQQIFIPFKRLHGANISGAGIGLATCKRIVERFGGQIWVESTPGEGSCFYFSLPAVEGASHAA